MKHLILAAVVMGSVSSFGATLSCRVADAGNGNRVAVPVTIVRGAQIVEPKVVMYNGYQVSVQYQTGDQFDSQTMLTLKADEAIAQTYNVSQKGLYQLMRKDLFLQCSFK